MIIDIKGIAHESMYLALRDEPKEGEDSNGANNTAVIIALSIIGGLFGCGLLWMLWAFVMTKKYGKGMDG